MKELHNVHRKKSQVAGPRLGNVFTVQISEKWTSVE